MATTGQMVAWQDKARKTTNRCSLCRKTCNGFQRLLDHQRTLECGVLAQQINNQKESHQDDVSAAGGGSSQSVVPQCDVCLLYFASYYGLDQHRVRMHNDKAAAVANDNNKNESSSTEQLTMTGASRCRLMQACNNSNSRNSQSDPLSSSNSISNSPVVQLPPVATFLTAPSSCSDPSIVILDCDRASSANITPRNITDIPNNNNYNNNAVNHRRRRDDISASSVIQAQLELFLHEQNLTSQVKLLVREVRTVNRSFLVSNFVKALFDLPSTSINYTASTILLFEKIGDDDVLVYALFAQEYCDDLQPLRTVVTHFGSPSCLLGLNDEFHSEMFHRLLLAYFSYARAAQFQQVFLSTKNVQFAVEQPSRPSFVDEIFNASSSTGISSEWFFLALEETAALNFTGCETLSNYIHRLSKNDSPDNAKSMALSCLFDNEVDSWSLQIERTALSLLQGSTSDWSEKAQALQLKRMTDVLLFEVASMQPFIVATLKEAYSDSDIVMTPARPHKQLPPHKTLPPMTNKKGNPLVIDASLEVVGTITDSPAVTATNNNNQTINAVKNDLFYLSSPRLFSEKCREFELTFDSLQGATRATQCILGQIDGMAMASKRCQLL